MNKVIRAEFGRTINAGLIIAIAGIIFSICFDSFNDLIACLRNGQGYVGYFFSNAAFGGMCTHYMLPVFTALPFSVSLCQERNNKAVSYIVSREGKTDIYLQNLSLVLYPEDLLQYVELYCCF